MPSYRFDRGRVTRQHSASNTYAVRPDDEGRFVSCLVTGSNAGGFETTEPSEAKHIGGS